MTVAGQPVSGHEARFRQMYAVEASGALERLSRDLLALEQPDAGTDLLTTLFREVHNLKGGAAVVGLSEVGRVAHAMEDVLDRLRRGGALPAPEVVEALLTAVDALGALIPALVADAPHGVDVAAVEAALRGCLSLADPPAGRPPTPAPAERVAALPTPPTVQVPVDRLDDIIRLAGEGTGAQLRLGRYLGERLHADPVELTGFRELSAILAELQERTTRTRMVPVEVATGSLQRAVRDLARRFGKRVRWEAQGTETELDRSVVEQLAGPLLHLVRNAVDHGIEPPAERVAAGKPEEGVVRLDARQVGSEVIITVADDGRGVDVPKVRRKAQGLPDASGDPLYLIFHSGLSTADEVTDVSGRGVGLDVVRASLDAIRGRIEVRSEPGRHTTFTIAVPITLTVLPCLVVSSGGQRYALPLHTVVTALPPGRGDEMSAGQPYVWVGEEMVPVTGLAHTLTAGTVETGPAVVLTGFARRHAFRVERLLGQRDVVVKPLSPVLPRLSVFTGASAEPDGSVLLVLDSTGLIDRARAAPPAPAPRAPGPAPEPRTATVLVVDDALIVREMQRAILERAGYRVLLAGDGAKALELADSHDVDLVLTDVDMPTMDGIALTRTLRERPRLAGTGIVILTSLGSDEDRRRGMEAGADAYIVKSEFDEAALLAVVRRTLGEAT